MADEDLNRPYIGYRSAGRRPESQQDRRASADAPLAALRGFLSGVLGAPGDIESLVRMLPGLSERTVLPTSEDVERRLPLRSVSETPVGRVATTGGQLAGGFYNGPGSPLRAVAALPSAVGRAGREFLQSNVPAHVIKPKGGNWLTGSVEEAISPLRSASSDDPLNKWLETKLSKYMRNEMATPEDPLRALAARGVSHLPAEELQAAQGWVPEGIGAARVTAGYPYEGMAWKAHQAAGFPEGPAEDLARAAEGWENLADIAVTPKRVSDLQLLGERSPTIKANPWLEKVAPETSVYSVDPTAVRDLGFRHLTDELRNALNPESGLPANLLLTPEQLGRVSTPQAVELVHKINQYRAAEKAAADFARATGPATHLFKEYPEAGYKWVELKARGPKATSVEGAKSDQELIRKELEDALKYEGDTMGHCVGEYCPDVMEGLSRIFSLRSAKGEPHVTIEAAPGAEGEPMDIIQIKGKQNRAPNEKYLPFVQDFVRSQKWGDIGDLDNVGLYDVGNRESLQRLVPRLLPQENEYVGAKMLQNLLPPGGQRYFTEQELRDLVQSQNKSEGFASGGLVTYNPAEVEKLTAPLRAELGLQ